MKRCFEYAKMQYEWIVNCLTEDKKWEELAFFELGVDLGVRLSELRSIKWEQIEFPYVKSIKISKQKSPEIEEYYHPLCISTSTFEACNRIYDNNIEDFIFQYNPYHYIGSISESIGSSFSGHDMRKINIAFRENSLYGIK